MYIYLNLISLVGRKPNRELAIRMPEIFEQVDVNIAGNYNTTESRVLLTTEISLILGVFM